MKLSTKTSLRIMYLEAALTSMIFAMPIISIFYKDEIGMSLFQVGLSQAIFIAVVLLLNIPTGWLADRFSLKWSNVLGNSLAALGFLYYAFVQDFTGVVIAEILIGMGISFSAGADTGILRGYSQKLKISYRKVMSNIASIKPGAELVAMLSGGVVGAFNPRLAIGLSFLSYGLAAILTALIEPAGQRRISHHNPFVDMAKITKYALHGHPELKWNIFAYAVAKEITHPIVWIFTPLMLLAGVPVAVLGVGWGITLLLAVAGAQLAKRYASKFADWQQFIYPMIGVLLASAIMAIDINLATIFLYGVFGLARGWFSAVTLPMVQSHTPDDIQATVVSVASSVSHLLYIPLVIGIGILADISLNLALVGGLLFAPVVLILTIKLRQFHRP